MYFLCSFVVQLLSDAVHVYIYIVVTMVIEHTMYLYNYEFITSSISTQVQFGQKE